MTVAEAKDILPVLKAAQDPDIQRHLTRLVTLGSIDGVRAGDAGDWITANWVAHSLAMEKAEMAIGLQPMAGDLISMSMTNANGQVSKSTDAASIERRQKNPLLETPWGREVDRQLRIMGMGAVAF